MMDLLSGWMVLAQEQGAPQSPFELGNLLLPLVIIGLAFYLLILRPQGRERKEREKQLAALGKGDRIITIGGLHGKVTRLGSAGKTIEIELAKNVRIIINKSAVSSIIKRAKGKAEGEEEETEPLE